MDDSGQTQQADGTTRIRFIPTYQKLHNIANKIESGDVSDKELAINVDQLRIIADEIEREPNPAVLANRIYQYIRDWTTASFASKDLRESGSFLTPVFVYNAILDILTDQYRHLDTVQREKITAMTADIMATGDGGDNTMDVSEARALMVRENWSIAKMLEWCQLEEDGLRHRLDFNPDTGKEWHDE